MKREELEEEHTFMRNQKVDLNGDVDWWQALFAEQKMKA